MQNSLEGAREPEKPAPGIIDRALQHYEQGKELADTHYKRRLEKAIAEFEELFAIVAFYHDPAKPLFFHRENILPDAYKYCGLAHLKLSYERLVDHPESHLKKSIENFLYASYYRSKTSRKDKQPTTKWEEIQSSCNDYIEKYKQGEARQESKAFFSLLISDGFNQLIEVNNTSTGKIKDAIMGFEIIDIESELGNFSQAILTFYARLYEYRGYSYKQVENFYAAKFDLERVCNIYRLIQRNTSETDDVISAIKKTIQELEQKIDDLKQKSERKLEDAKRRNAQIEVAQRFRSGFFRDFVKFFLYWMAVLCSFLKTIILFTVKILPMLATWIKELESQSQRANKEK
ncbi:hypothetical protein [Calothrix sp. NIES-2098]|uniref:hypothetical protein n=1 Tax=Calothrix sp. NIES-2098 TaxID=1954171 RepID=UPI000B61EFCF|nr:hypothetical protein NIES2098_32070 [Calothrix sp. NIES-2098]